MGKEVKKAPPGPPPREGLKWKEETSRWIRPNEEILPKRRSGEQRENESKKKSNTTVKNSISKVGESLNLEFKQLFKKSIELKPPIVHSRDFFNKLLNLKQSDGSLLDADSILGFYSGNGVNIPDDAEDYTIIHELGHQFHEMIFDSFGDEKGGIISIMDDLYKEKSFEDFITGYAATNNNEYFAECFATYVNNPELLEFVDPEAYEIMEKFSGKEQEEQMVYSEEQGKWI